MFRLIRRIILILLILGIGYGIYRLIDRQLSKEESPDLSNDLIQETSIITPSQDSGIVLFPTESFGSGNDSAVVPSTAIEPSLGDPSEILAEESIIIKDPIIKEPIKTTVVQPAIAPKPAIKTTPKTTIKKTSSSNILFLLFK